MAYTVVGFGILFVTALLGGFIDWEVEHVFSHAALAAFITGAFMIFGADWLLQRTAWGRRHSEGMGPPHLDALK
jgi:hypothetical protein